MKIRTIIIDDNAKILESLTNHLNSINYVDLIYSTLDSDDFLETTIDLKPDLVIMDIDMPRINGIELGKLLREKLPFIEIIFVTSHGEYIKDAISVYASDFIEKPYDSIRLNSTLLRLANKMNISDEFFEIKSNKNILHIRLNDIIAIEASKRKVIIYTVTDSFEANYTFKKTIDMLPSKYLYKSSRSFYINLLKVDSINDFSRTSYEITFKNSDITAMLSKNQYDEFRQLIKEIS